MSTDIEYLSATGLSAGFAAGSISPVAATAAALAAIDAQDGALNAFRLVDAEAARAAAVESERRWQAKSSLSLLDGVPVSIKDLLLTKGWPTLRGSKLVDPEQAWVEDATRCGASARGWRGSPEQDKYRGVRLERRDRQPAHRHYPQSVES
ncbi:MAG: amidase family protein [Alphaproteobacteria bacterium]